MHYRRIVCFLLGVWLGGGLLMAWYGARSFGTVEGKVSLGIMLVMLGLTLIQRFLISPELGTTARIIGFVQSDLAAQEHARFWLLHNSYLTLEAMKAGFGVILGVIVMSGRRSV